jgi:ferredoxin
MTKIKFVRPSGDIQIVSGREGDTILTVAQANGIDMEGACEGSMACSTCHVIIDDDWASKLPPPSDEELDMLDLTYGLTRTSRLGCQIRIRREIDGLTLYLPSETHNMMD